MTSPSTSPFAMVRGVSCRCVQIERLGDHRQDVRQAACNALLELLQVLRPDALMEKIARYWNHKSWKVRHGLLQFLAEAVCMVGEPVLVAKDEANSVIHQVIRLVEDPERYDSIVWLMSCVCKTTASIDCHRGNML